MEGSNIMGALVFDDKRYPVEYDLQENNEVEMLEVLKEDYLGMQYKVSYDKTMTWAQKNIDMNIVGMTFREEMSFVDWDDFEKWKQGCNANRDCRFVITNGKPVNGQLEMDLYPEGYNCLDNHAIVKAKN